MRNQGIWIDGEGNETQHNAKPPIVYKCVECGKRKQDFVSAVNDNSGLER
jgi:hypothetical protein